MNIKLMLLTLLLQEPTTRDTGYNIGYAIGENLPYIIVLILAFFVFKYFKNKSKK